MSIFDEARALALTMKMRNLSNGEMAKSLGVSNGYISNKLRLLSLEEDVQREITEQGLSERHARALLRLNSTEDRRAVLDRIKEDRLSVAETEALVDVYKRGESREEGLFIDALEKSINSLLRAGIKAEKKTVKTKSKTYITICISTQNNNYVNK